MFELLAAKESIQYHPVDLDVSEIKISCVIARKYAELAVRTLHDGFGLASGRRTNASLPEAIRGKVGQVRGRLHELQEQIGLAMIAKVRWSASVDHALEQLYPDPDVGRAGR